MNRLGTAVLSLLFAVGTAGVAAAQQYGYPYQYGNQGQYQQRHHRRNRQCNGNGYNSGYGYNNRSCATVRGTIVGVNGNQVTLDLNRANYGGNYSNDRDNDGDNDRDDGRCYGGRGGRQITIDDQPALNNRTSGRVAVGRYVTAFGYWQNGVFYATEMN
jgi:hypothetical protein